MLYLYKEFSAASVTIHVPCCNPLCLLNTDVSWSVNLNGLVIYVWIIYYLAEGLNSVVEHSACWWPQVWGGRGYWQSVCLTAGPFFSFQPPPQVVGGANSYVAVKTQDARLLTSPFVWTVDWSVPILTLLTRGRW